MGRLKTGRSFAQHPSHRASGEAQAAQQGTCPLTLLRARLFGLGSRGALLQQGSGLLRRRQLSLCRLCLRWGSKQLREQLSCVLLRLGHAGEEGRQRWLPAQQAQRAQQGQRVLRAAQGEGSTEGG